MDNFIFKFIWKCKKDQEKNKIILESKNKVEALTLTNCKAYPKDTVLKKIRSWYKGRPIHRWNRLEGPEIDPRVYNKLILTKVISYLTEKNIFFQ